MSRRCTGSRAHNRSKLRRWSSSRRFSKSAGGGLDASGEVSEVPGAVGEDGPNTVCTRPTDGDDDEEVDDDEGAEGADEGPDVVAEDGEEDARAGDADGDGVDDAREAGGDTASRGTRNKGAAATPN
ncbi:unnamed protein product, partial [Pylaiella littoralis]